MHDKPDQEEVSAMKTAFLYEVRPDVFLKRIGWTAYIVGMIYCGMLIYRNGAFLFNLLLPYPTWRTHNPDGSLYLEVWATVLANALQIAFGSWAAWLLILGVVRILFARKFIRTCFTLGTAFGITAVVLPYLITVFFNWVIAKYPALAL